MSRVLGSQVEEPPTEGSGFEHGHDRPGPSRWIGWRLRLLLLLALAGGLLALALIRALMNAPAIEAQWQPDALNRAVLYASDEARLQPYLGLGLLQVADRARTLEVDAALLLGTPRWTVDDEARASLIARRAALNAMFADGSPLTLIFSEGLPVTVDPRPRGARSLGLPLWLLAGPAFLLYLLGAAVLLARPQAQTLLYALMAWCQALSLVWIGVDGSRGLSAIATPLLDDVPWRLGLDLATAAAAVHAFALHPVRLRAHSAIGAGAWLFAAAGIATVAQRTLVGQWWWGQALLFGLGLAAIGVLSWAHHDRPHPFAAVMRRFGFVVLGTLAAVSVAVAAATWQPAMAYDVATSAVLVWTLFFASVLVWVPFLAGSRHLLREFAMFAGLATVATSLDLLFVSLFALEPFTSLTLAVFIALAVYAVARHWMFNQITGSALLSTERTFEQLYRVARELQKHPERQLNLVGQLLRELFEPLELHHVPRDGDHARVVPDGSAMMVPVAPVPGSDGPNTTLVLRYADRGRRIFTRDDARLTERVVEQLRSAVAYDSAVERGRAEERLRIAQDLHDDIGARLLTLMYRTRDPEMEDYLRHTLKDLKTLTRGLAASEHRLSDSAAEWKADLQQRLTAAQIQLNWSLAFDEDLMLTVVQWSALTRVLRELVSNTIHHAQATQVDVSGTLERGEFRLQVADDGQGRRPETWAHGLGLGGVRKRVKLLGGEVRWRENEPQGVVCEVRIPALAQQD